jgi:hypothetical protein
VDTILTGLLALLGAPLIGLALLFLLLVLVVAVMVLYDRWQRISLRRRFTARWGPAGKDLLLVYSDSPHWKHYIETTWLPPLHERAIVLNWSQRSTWPAAWPLEAAIVRRWAGRREFNPLALVIPPRGPVTMVRFWRAFREYKHGKDRALRQAEQRLADALGVPPFVAAQR